MKKFFINTHIMFFIILLFSSVIGQVNDEIKMFVEVKYLIQGKNYKQAEEKLDTLLINYSDSERIEKYYFMKNELYQQMLDENKDEKQNITTKSNSHSRGTVFIRLGEKYSGEKAVLEEKRIKNWEQYLYKVSNGNKRELVLLALMMIYTKEDSNRIISIANELMSSSDDKKNKYAHFYKALIFHSSNQYKNAIDQYRKAIELSTDNEEKAKFQLYISDCYYQLGEDQVAMNSLEQVEELEHDLENKYMTKLAEIWKEYFQEEFNRPLNERKQLVFIE